MHCFIAGPAILASLLLLGGCAASMPTRAISPVVVDASAFAEESCAQLALERQKRSQALIFLGLGQDHLAEEDRRRTLGLPTPLGSPFEEDNWVEIAQVKGELNAIDEQLAARRCGADFG